MAHPLKEKNKRLGFVSRLQKLTKGWQEMAEPSLKHSYKLWKAMESGYHTRGYQRQHTINLIARGVDTIVPFLVNGNPRTMVTTKIPKYKPWAKTTELALDYFLSEIQFAERVLIPVARNSLMSAGVTRTSIVHHRNYEREEGVYKLGRPHVEVVDFSNYIGDPGARRREEFIFEGDMYRLPTDYAKEFWPTKADLIVSDSKLMADFDPAKIAKGDYDKNSLSLRDSTTFIDVYLYDEGIILTILPDGHKPVIINQQEWEGPEGGPYDFLGYRYIADTPIPLPPAWDWHDMDVTTNLLVDKMRQQAEAQKNIIAVQGHNTGDADRLREAPNNGIVTFESLEDLQELSWGGVNDKNYDWVAFMLQQFVQQGMNTDLLGGKGPSADTLGQEQMVYANATRMIGNMANRFHNFMGSVVKKLAWAFWVEPTTYVPIVREVPGIGSVDAVFRERDKVGDFYDFVFDVQAYSTQRELPETKYNKLMQFLTQWILPTMERAAAQGVTINIEEATEQLAQYLGIDSFSNWFKGTVPGPLEGAGGYQVLPNDTASLMMNDSFGASQASREGNMFQQQVRAGGQPSPNQQTGEPNA